MHSAETRKMPDKGRLPHALYRAEQVRELDRIAIEDQGIAGRTLMERAGAAAFALIRERWPEADKVCVLCGVGNNAGDGYVVARLAMEEGLDVQVLQLGEFERLQGDARTNYEAFEGLGGAMRLFDGIPRGTELIVDAVFGTGLERPVEGEWREALEAAAAHPAPVIAIDMPSGLHADSGRVLGFGLKAECTISFIGLKQGLFTGEGPEYAGEVFFNALEVPALIYSSVILSARRIDWTQQSGCLGRRSRNAHKGDFGHVLVVGGDSGFSGAALMAGEGAARAGAGLVTLATRPEHAPLLNLARPELMVHGVRSAEELGPLLERASVIALGPGLGRGPWGMELAGAALQSGKRLVVDADALHLLVEHPARREDWVLTPHPGEAARLLGISVDAVQADRFAAVAALYDRFGGVSVLKGAGALVQSSNRRPPAVCSEGNPGMASGGMGDVLTGVIAGLLAQGLTEALAAEAGVCLHAAAGDRAALGGERGLLATDLLPHLRRLANPDD